MEVDLSYALMINICYIQCQFSYTSYQSLDFSKLIKFFDLNFNIIFKIFTTPNGH